MAASKAVMAKAKALFEAGENISAIGEKLRVSYNSIKSWAKKNKWIPAKNTDELQKIAVDSLKKEAEAHGLTMGRALAKIAHLLDSQDILVRSKTGFIKFAKPKGLEGDEMGIGELEGVKVRIVDDRDTQLRAAKVAVDVLNNEKMLKTGLLQGSENGLGIPATFEVNFNYFLSQKGEKPVHVKPEEDFEIEDAELVAPSSQPADTGFVESFRKFKGK